MVPDTSVSSPVAEAATVGRLLVATDTVHALRDAGTARSLQSGSVIYDGDIINTGTNSMAQVRFDDGTLIRLKPNSQFRIDEYRFDKASNSLTRVFYSLLKGGFRSVTSLISGKNKRAYRVNTAMATIGIHGTDYEADICSSNCASGKAGNLELNVHDGAIAVRNNAGEFRLRAGDITYVPGRNLPVYYLPELIVAAKERKVTPAKTVKTITVVDDIIKEEIINPEIVDNPIDFVGGDALQCVRF